MPDLEARARDLIARQERERLAAAVAELAAEDARQQQEQARQEALAGFAARLEALDGKLIDKARENLARALERFAETVDAYNDEIAAVRADLQTAGLQVDPAVDYRADGGYPGVTVNGTARRQQAFQTPIVDLIRDVHQRHYPDASLNLKS